MKRMSFVSELHFLNMSEKELPFQPGRWAAWLSAKRGIALALLCCVGLLWVTPVGLKWLLVQQLQQALKREVKVDALHIHPWSLSLSVDGLSVKNAEGTEFVGWQRLTVNVSAQSFTQRALVLDEFTLQGPRVSVVHLGQGRFDFSDLLVASSDNSSPALPPFVLHAVAIHDGQVRVEDRSFQRTHTVDKFKLVLPLVSSLSGKHGLTLTPELSAIVNGAPLQMTGKLQPLADVPEGVLALTLSDFDVAGLQPYLQSFMPEPLPMRLAHGKLSTDLKLAISEASGRMALLLGGTAHLENWVLNDARDRALLSFTTLELALSPSDVLAGPVTLSHVMLDAPKATVRISPEGQPSQSSTKPANTNTNPKANDNASPALAVHVNQFTLRNGAVDFFDASVKPTVQSRMTDLNAVVNNISNQANTPADATLKAKLDGKATLDVQARMQPRHVTSFLDAKVQAKQVDLSRFSGYVQKYLGYPLDKGKLSFEASYRIKDKQLQANNHVLIDQLTLGDPVPSPHAIDAPVSLGVSLLKNSRGQIDIDLPMSGSVDAPDFSFGGLVAQTFGNVLVKVVTAPVRAIGGLVGGDEKTD
jgi:uncharacterized protein involved in outer membrane biogenesis